MKKNPQKIKYQIILTVFLFCCLTLPAEVNPAISSQDIIITLNPKYPAAHQMVTLKAEIYVTDINRAEIAWFVDGGLKKKGTGEKEFSFRTKALGETTVINIQMNTADAGQINKRIKITPAEINLLWEADTYTPPFYKGKALNTHEAVIKIVALPNFIDSYDNQIDAKNLIYKWQKDWKTSGDKSGYGKNSFSFTGPQIFKGIVITVEVESLDGLLKSKQNLSISARRPEIIFYEKDPLLGILDNNAIGEIYNQSQEELSLVARPFFFSKQNLESQIKYDWKMNGKTIDNSSAEITLRKERGKTGISLISLKIQNLEKIMQFTENSFKINPVN